MTTATPWFQIDAIVEAALSYALAHNEIPVLRSLSVTNLGGTAVSAVVHLTIEDDQGVLTRPCALELALAAGRETPVSELNLRLDPGQLLRVEERRPGFLRVRVLVDGIEAAEQSFRTEILAAHQWVISIPLELSWETLAAFVLPNDPAIVRLMSEVSARLEVSTGSNALQGYQSGPERVDQIVAAIYDAMVARDIHYSEPPASWADDGQKVRTPTEVLDGRVGTCLDTTVVMAAALEQAGIRPLLWVVEGHAFLGYWRQELDLGATATIRTTLGEPVPGIVNLVNRLDLGHLQLVETTMITGGTKAPPFSSTHRSPAEGYLTGDLSRVYCVTDVWVARQSGIRPLPSITRTDEGELQVVEYRPTEHSRVPQGYVNPRPNPRPTDDSSSGRIETWKNALLDLTRRNPLISFKRGVTVTVPPDRLGTIEDLLNAHYPLTLLPSDQLDAIALARGVRTASGLDPRTLAEILDTRRAVFCSVPTGRYPSDFRALATKAKSILGDTGSNDLYLALGSLHWAIDGKDVKSPLILVPVTLHNRTRTGEYTLEMDESGSSTPNFCLLEKLKQLHRLEIPGLAKPAEDDSGIDLDAVLTSVREAVAEAKLPYRVEASADLALLSFAKYRLWKDLDEHAEQFLQNPLVRHLVETPTAPFRDPVTAAPIDLDALAALCPVPADASQLAAISWAVAGRTFVLEGPPGTGKSQTITNLLARAVADGKKILFVAEKRAALDVVHKRLSAIGMSPFCLDLHDKASKPEAVRQQVRLALDHQVEQDAEGFAVAATRQRAAGVALARYAEKLHAPNGAGLSFYSARTQELAIDSATAPLPVPRTLLAEGQAENLAVLRLVFDQLPETAESAQPGVHHPYGFLHPDVPSRADVLALVAATRAVTVAFTPLTFNGVLGAAVQAIRTSADLSLLAALAGHPVPLDLLDQAGSPDWLLKSAALTAELVAFRTGTPPGLHLVTPEALALPLVELQTRVNAAVQGGLFGRKQKLQAVVDELRPVLRTSDALAHKALPELLGALLHVQRAVQDLAARVIALPGLVLPLTWNPLTEAGQHYVTQQIAWLSWAGHALRPVPSEGPSSEPFPALLRSFVASPTGSGPGSAGLLATAAAALQQLSSLAGTDAQHWAGWSGAHGLVEQWARTAPGRQESEQQPLPLRRWLAFLEALHPLQGLGLDEAHRWLRTGRCHAEEARDAFEAGLARTAWLERAETTGLDLFDAQRHLATVQTFTSTTQKVREALVEVLPAQILAARPVRSEDSQKQLGTLTRELNRQRGKALGVRQLLHTYGSLITELMPCVLVSPDSVARFFPVGGELFDIVVFDEASQIRVADAVGAMGRARSVVVVGDSKQMPPTTFAEATVDAEEENEVEGENPVVQDEESILSECRQALVDRRLLSWHYRSADESLIAFSNEHYYEGKLSSFPGPVLPLAVGAAAALPNAHRAATGISLVRLEGVYLRSGDRKLLKTNALEARAVLDELQRRFDASPEAAPSIGVVTFNLPQRTQIEELIHEEGCDRMVESLKDPYGDSLFVKNLENVQGDERDVILFSTGFSPNEQGFVPLTLGPLNRQGGERRLNVAVTRARRQVIVFTSFDPSMLRTGPTTALGVQHLRDYLELAAGGTSSLGSGRSNNTPPDRHRDQIAQLLRKAGLVVHTDVGLSDFKIDIVVAKPELPQQPVLAILLDGLGWAKRETITDRDALPSSVLLGLMGWPAVERVWAPEWIADPLAVIERLAAVAAKVTTTTDRK